MEMAFWILLLATAIFVSGQSIQFKVGLPQFDEVLIVNGAQYHPRQGSFSIVSIDDLTNTVSYAEKQVPYETPIQCIDGTESGNFVCVDQQNGDIYLTSWAKEWRIKNNTKLRVNIQFKSSNTLTNLVVDIIFSDSVKRILSRAETGKIFNELNSCGGYFSTKQMSKSATNKYVYYFKITDDMKALNGFTITTDRNYKLAANNRLSFELYFGKSLDDILKSVQFGTHRGAETYLKKSVEKNEVKGFTHLIDSKATFQTNDIGLVMIYDFRDHDSSLPKGYLPNRNINLNVSYLNHWSMCERKSKCFGDYTYYRNTLKRNYPDKDFSMERCSRLRPRVEIKITKGYVQCEYHSSADDFDDFTYVLLNGTTKIWPTSGGDTNLITKRSMETSVLRVKIAKTMYGSYVQCAVFDSLRMAKPALSDKNIITLPRPSTTTRTSSTANLIGNVKLIPTIFPKKTVPRGGIISLSEIVSIATDLKRKMSKQKSRAVNLTVIDEVLNAMDNVLNSNQSLFAQPYIENKTSSTFLTVLDQVGSKLSSMVNSSKKNITIAKKNIVVYVGYAGRANVTLTARRTINQNFRIEIQNTSDYVKSPTDLAVIHLPAEVFNGAGVVYSYLFKNNALFVNNQTNLLVQSAVISATIKNRSVENLKQPVRMTFKKTLDEAPPGKDVCSFWEDTNNAWSTRGCELYGNPDNSTVSCSCNHLTNFALLLDVNQQLSNPFALKVVTWVGCSLSLVGLALTLFTFLFLSKLRKNLPTKILIQLCFALIGLLLTFLIGAERATLSRLGCQATSATIQFFLLASFSWMFVEAANLYRYCVQVFRTIGDFSFLWKSFVLAWGFPALGVTITVLLRPEELGNEKLCIVHGKAFYFGVLVPVCSILTLNFVILALSVHSLCTSNPVGTAERDSFVVKLRITFACATLLGLSWAFGVLAVSYVTSTFQWMFCITTSLQGFLIFVFHTVRNSDVRKEWRKKLGSRDHTKLSFNSSTKTYELKTNTLIRHS